MNRHRPSPLTWPIIAVVFVLLAMFSCYRQCRGQEPLPGTVYVSRNHDESLNTSPGYWNHLAIYVGSGEIVEAQPETGVAIVKLSDYLVRDYEVIRYLPRTAELGERAAVAARSFVGQPYGKFASVNPIFRFGRHNCVSVVEAAYDVATNHRWLWIRRPDHVKRLVDWGAK